MRIIVVGAGFWGVAITLVLERSGHHVTLVGSPTIEPASAVASGYASLAWHPAKDGTAHARAIDALATSKLFGVQWTDASAIHVYPGKPDKVRSGLMTFWPHQVLALRKRDVLCGVQEVGERGVHYDDGYSQPADAVVLATGYATDDLLQRSGLKPLGVGGLPGSALYYEVTSSIQERYGLPNSVLWRDLNPYSHYAARDWHDGTVRVCATLERRPNARTEYLLKMSDTMTPYLGRGALVRPAPVGSLIGVSGMRPVTPDGPTVATIIGKPRIIVATGGGRVGALLAWWAAERVNAIVKELR